MTKIYLVKGKLVKQEGKIVNVNFNVFTNKKLAKTYMEYKNLQTKLHKPDYLTEYEFIKFEIEEFIICKIDWKKDLLKLQMEELPY